ncbi:MAG: hypothetical protein ACRDHZ_11420 [Ktedonobacteraceae bacterium]
MIGWEDFTIAIKTNAQPTTITAAQLSRFGPPNDNRYVHVTDYDLSQEYIVEEKQSDSKIWDRVWLQALPKGKIAQDGGRPIVLKDGRISGEDDYEDFTKQPSFDGIVINGVTTIAKPDTPSGMNFPDIDQSKAWVVDIRDRPDTGTACGFALGGMILILGGGFMVFTRFRTRAKPGVNVGTTVGSRHKR